MPVPASSFQHCDLVWECLKKNNCYTKKFNGVTLTKDPMNVTGIHSKRTTGLTGNGVGVEMINRKTYIIKRNGKSRNPRKNIEKLRVGTNQKHSAGKIVKFIGESRPDLIHNVQKKLDIISKMHH